MPKAQGHDETIGESSEDTKVRLTGGLSSDTSSLKRDQPLKNPHEIKLTESERRFKEVQDKRKRKKIEEFVKKSHKEKVQVSTEFNERLARLPEHHDMPKVGPG
ncbi:hypothetical protein AX774_g811 [Zancudomyces culisetae]|uniref:Protein FAM32A n=1 Tax=Zancudomyces culisetae TaxID=1213189 RepID=A0A1R1PXD4_ZANCU|nr:hypothetical protein AX774_g811 [Zancudomyces culisetae]|eukprot:OMH85640.1 hypothetical protein AX774_g811 [Zancudomyces culisetae]